MPSWTKEETGPEDRGEEIRNSSSPASVASFFRYSGLKLIKVVLASFSIAMVILKIDEAENSKFVSPSKVNPREESVAKSSCFGIISLEDKIKIASSIASSSYEGEWEWGLFIF